MPILKTIRARLDRPSGSFVALLCLLAVFAIPLFFYKLGAQYPNGYAGLFALMAETVAGNGFALPVEIPFYGPGGIPFAYPPLSFYLMAFATNGLTIAPFDYMRLAPSVFLLLSLIPMFALTKALTSSLRQAVIATALMGASVGILDLHYDAAGICRGLALLVMLGSMYFSYLSFKSTRVWPLVLAAIFLAATILTHFTYAVFGTLSIILFSLGTKEMPLAKRMIFLVATGLLAGVLTLPWWIVVLDRHGIQVFLYALSTHGSTSFIQVLGAPASWIDLLRSNVLPSFESLLLTGTALLGLAIAIATRKWFLPLWLLATVWITGLEGQRFAAIVCALLGAFALDRICDWLAAGGMETEGRLRVCSLYLVDLCFTLTVIACAFMLRLGGSLPLYLPALSWTLIVGGLGKPAVYIFSKLYRRQWSLAEPRELLKIGLSITAASAFITLTMLVLSITVLDIPGFPRSVFVIDWLLSLLCIGGVRYAPLKAKLDQAAPTPVVLFLALVGVLGWIVQPPVFSIDPNERAAFFSQAGDLSGWFRENGRPDGTYLLVSTDIEEREWFPYLLRYEPAMSGFGAEWTAGFARQIRLLEGLTVCVEEQSLPCLETFVETNQLAPDYLITPAGDGPRSISASLAAGGSSWTLLYSNDGYEVWGASPSAPR